MTIDSPGVTISKGGLEPGVVGVSIDPGPGETTFTASDPTDCFVLPDTTTVTINGAPMVVGSYGEYVVVAGLGQCKSPTFGLGGPPRQYTSDGLELDEIVVSDGTSTRRMTTTIDEDDITTEKVTLCEFTDCYFEPGW